MGYDLRRDDLQPPMWGWQASHGIGGSFAGSGSLLVMMPGSAPHADEISGASSRLALPSPHMPWPLIPPSPLGERPGGESHAMARAPRTPRRPPLASRYQPPPSLPAGDPIRARDASTRVTSIPPQRSSRSPCGRQRPPRRGRCARHRHGVVTAALSACWPIGPGPPTVCTCRGASGRGCAAIATAGAVSSPHACPPVWALGPGARCGSPRGEPQRALVVGGQPGGPRSQQWALVVSRTTLLRLRRRPPVPSLPTPTVLGGDDGALRNGQTEGTVRIDLER